MINGIGQNEKQARGTLLGVSAAQSTASAEFKNALKNAGGLPGYQTTTDLDDIFHRASEQYGVPVALLKAVGKAESGFNAKAVSSCGAQGIMQLMPGTAKALGVRDAFDPEQNIMGGASYLRQKLDQYDGDISLTLAAYNAGSGNVAKYGGVPPFKETQSYIKKVFGYMDENPSAGQILSGTEGIGRTTVGTGVLDEADLNGQIDIRDAISIFVQSLGNGRNLGSIPDTDESVLIFPPESDII